MTHDAGSATGVMTLQWHEQLNGEHEAETPFGFYTISKLGDGCALNFERNFLGEYPTPDAAKAAAQRDLATKHAALALPASPEVKGLKEAAFAIIDWRHEWNESELEPEAVAAFDALEKALGEWTP